MSEHHTARRALECHTAQQRSERGPSGPARRAESGNQ